MPSRFDKLVSIIGPVLGQRVIEKLGPGTVWIRKKLDLSHVKYLESQIYYDSISVLQGAKELGCSPTTLRWWRSVDPKTYVE